ncbi:MAG TPA: hypothetical protein VFC67_21930 [Prolixibacteraceae bacterium]|nr:hypothetical protein [Prolixibacteraceae bacterium]
MRQSMEILFGGLSKIEMTENEFDLGEGIFIRKTYAHLFAPFMMAFKPPGKYKHHEGPWKSAKGGISFDILVEIEMPLLKEFNDNFDSEEMIWIIASLIRLSCFPYLVVSAISDISFSKIPESEKEPTIFPFETKNRIFSPVENVKPFLSIDDLCWLKENWKRTVTLLKENSKFYLAFKAFDSASIQGKPSTSLINIWGAIEQLFSPNTGELKYRVSSNLAAFLQEHGDKRLEVFKELSHLYNDRSIVAHTAKEIDYSPVVSSYIHLRNALMKIIELGFVPSQDYLEELIFKPTTKNGT